MKKVNYQVFWQALKTLRRNYCAKGIEISLLSSDEEPVKLGVNWPSIGTVPPEQAEEFAKQMLRTAEAVKSFAYSDYLIEF